MSVLALQTVARGRIVLAGCPPVPYTIWFRLGESVVSVECGGVTRHLRWNNQRGRAPFRPDSSEHLAAVIARFDTTEPEIEDDRLEVLNRELAAERSSSRDASRRKDDAHVRQLPAGDRA